jgi:hypothetical protein
MIAQRTIPSSSRPVPVLTDMTKQKKEAVWSAFDVGFSCQWPVGWPLLLANILEKPMIQPICGLVSERFRIPM